MKFDKKFKANSNFYKKVCSLVKTNWEKVDRQTDFALAYQCKIKSQNKSKENMYTFLNPQGIFPSKI